MLKLHCAKVIIRPFAQARGKKHNFVFCFLFSLFRLACMYTISGLTTCNWITIF